jgi:hypothetical protein
MKSRDNVNDKLDTFVQKMADISIIRVPLKIYTMDSNERER